MSARDRARERLAREQAEAQNTQDAIRGRTQQGSAAPVPPSPAAAPQLPIYMRGTAMDPNRPPPRNQTGGVSWRNIPEADGFAARQPGFAALADGIQGVVSGALDAGAEAVDALGALGVAWHRWAAPQVLGEDEYEEVRREQAAFTQSVNRIAGQRVLSDSNDGEFFPDAQRLVETPESAVGQIADGISQFVTGYATLGRVLGPARELSRLQVGARGLAQGAAVDFSVFDGNEARLSNLLRDVGGLRDPVTAYLAASEDDEEVEGRIKAVLEGAGVGLLVEAFMGSLRAMRAYRHHVRAPTPQTESEVADAVRRAQEAADLTTQEIQAQTRRQEQARRRADIETDAQSRLAALERQVYGEGVDPSRSANPNSVEIGEINSGARDPTSLSQRQEEALKLYNAEREKIEAHRTERTRIADMQDAADAGNTSDVLRIFQEINKGRDRGTGRAGPAPLQARFGRGGDPVKEMVGNIVTDKFGSVFNLGELRPVVRPDGSVILFPKSGIEVPRAAEGPRGPRITAEEGTAVPSKPNLTASEHTVDVIPDSPLDGRNMVRVARAQSARLASAADAPPTHAEGVAMRAESDRVSDLADELDAAIREGANVNEAASRLLAHLDDESTRELFPRRQAGATDKAIGQTDAQGFARAVGDVAPETPVVDESFVRELAERYSRVKDVASASVRQRAEAWAGGVPEVRARDINLEHVSTSDQVKAFVNSFADLSEGAIRHIRGETPDAVIGARLDTQRVRISQALAKDIGTDPGTLMLRLAELTGDTRHLDSKIEAMRMLHVTAADESQRAMKAYLASHSEADLSRALVALQSFSSIHASLKGAQSEVARALRSLQFSVSPDRSLVEQFSGIVDESLVRALDPQGGSRNVLEAMQKLGGAITHTNRRGMARIFEAKWHRAIEDYNTASVLSGPPTHVMNMFDNAINTLITPVERMIGGALHYPIERNLNGAREGFDQAIGMLASAREAWGFAVRAFKENRTFLDNTFDADYRSNFTAEAFGVNPSRAFGQSLNALGKVIGVVHRVMGSQDEFFKRLNYRAGLYASALREARAQGIKDGPAMRTFVDEFVTAGYTGNGKAIRAAVPANQLNLMNNAYDRALRTARRNTYTEDPGKVLGAAERGLRSIPLGRLVVPFFRTPIGIVKWALRRSPVPLSPSFYEDVLGKNGTHAQEQAMGQWGLGMVMYGSAVTYALSGGITGSGPSDPRVRQRLIESGWQPYSIRIGDRYHSYNRVGGLGIMLGVVADSVEMANEDFADLPEDPLEVAGLSVLHFAQMMRDKTFFQGVATIFDAIENQDEDVELDNLERLLGQKVGPIVPSFFARLTDDGFMHRPRSVLDAVLARTGARDRVEYRRNWLGERVGAPTPLLAHSFISPFTSTEMGTDNVLTEIARLAAVSGGGVSDVQRSIRGIDLTEFNSPVTNRNAYDRLQEIASETVIRGKTLRERLEEHISSDLYRTRLTDGDRDDGLEVRGSRQASIVRIRRQYLREAEEQLRAEIPELDARIRQEAAMRRGARRPNESNTDQGAAGLPRGLEWLAGP